MKQFKSNKIMIASLGYMLGGILIKGIAFITTPIFSRLMTPEEFGVLNTYLSYEAIIAMIIGFQFASSFKSANIEFRSHDNGIQSYFSKIVQLLLLHSAIATVLINILAPFLVDVTGINSILLWNLLVINCLGNALVTSYNSYVSLKYQYKKYLLLALLNACLNVVISLLLIMTFMKGEKSLGRILGYVIPSGLIAVYIVFIAFTNAKPRTKLGVEQRKFAYKYCSSLIPVGFSEVMLGQFGRLTVVHNCGYASMGIYSLSYNVYSIIGIIRIAMDYVVGPYYFDKRQNKDDHTIRTTTRFYSNALAVITAGIMMLSSEIVRILGDIEYYNARKCAIPLVAASYFVFLCSMISQEEYYKKKIYLVSSVSIIAVIFNVILCVLIIPRYETMGAAFCTLISYLIFMISHCLIVKSKLKCNVFPWKFILFDSVFVLGMMGIALIVVDKSLVRYMIVIILALTGFLIIKNNYKKIISE